MIKITNYAPPFNLPLEIICDSCGTIHRNEPGWKVLHLEGKNEHYCRTCWGYRREDNLVEEACLRATREIQEEDRHVPEKIDFHFSVMEENEE